MDLQIFEAMNGFIVHEGNPNSTMMGKSWAFESADSLADFIEKWGKDKENDRKALHTKK